MQTRSVLKALLAGAALVGAGAAQTVIPVTADISVSTHWTANNVYELQNQVYILPGATLTIDAGTVVASIITPTIAGTLIAARGGQIYVNGTERNPVVMTSATDRATWTGGNPRTGAWRMSTNEWGNLTLCGQAYISENAIATNTPSPNPSNYAIMEGLVASGPSDTRLFYGGGNDNDNSGSIHYLQLRYGGRVIGSNVELNGLSVGGVGRNTDIHHVEIMNSLDDAIETWGGTVNYRYISMWNAGDDSFDCDQGWRGTAQFVCIVQGFCQDAAQGSGWSDNGFEMDGAEDSDCQPVTTANIYNVTCIGCPTTPVAGGLGGTDHATAWRDGARVQFHNCIFMDTGERCVSFDNVDGDGAHGYGFNGTLTWAQCWTTPYTQTSTVNAPANPAAFYTTQFSGNLCEITDSVFYNNQHALAYTEANNVGVFAAANNNVQATLSPITSITRAAPFNLQTNQPFARVISLDPLPANDALTPVGYAPPGHGFESARFRGAFRPGVNWLLGWTASDWMGFVVRRDGWCDLGNSAPGTFGAPVMSATGTLAVGIPATLSLNNAKQSALTVLMLGFTRVDQSLAPYGFPGVTLVPNFNSLGYLVRFTNASGVDNFNLTVPAGFTGVPLYCQHLVFDTGAPNGLCASNAIFKTIP